MALVKNNPQRLVDYALHPDRFRYPRPPLSPCQLDILAREKQKEPEKNQASIDGRFRYRPPEGDSENKSGWKDIFTRDGKKVKGKKTWKTRDDSESEEDERGSGSGMWW